MRALALALFLALPAYGELRRVELTLFGMDGGTEAHAVRTALARVDGVQSVEVSLREGRAIVRLAPGNSARVEQLLRAVDGVALETRKVQIEPSDWVPKWSPRWNLEAARGKQSQWEVPAGKRGPGAVRLFRAR